MQEAVLQRRAGGRRQARQDSATARDRVPSTDPLEVDYEQILPSGKSPRRRWTATVVILAASLMTVGFVANAIKVNQLLDSITSVESEISTVQRENERLRSELNRLQSVDDIARKAEALGLMEPAEPPISIRSDGESD